MAQDPFNFRELFQNAGRQQVRHSIRRVDGIIENRGTESNRLFLRWTCRVKKDSRFMRIEHFVERPKALVSRIVSVVIREQAYTMRSQWIQRSFRLLNRLRSIVERHRREE